MIVNAISEKILLNVRAQKALLVNVQVQYHAHTHTAGYRHASFMGQTATIEEIFHRVRRTIVHISTRSRPSIYWPILHTTAITALTSRNSRRTWQKSRKHHLHYFLQAFE